MRPIVWLLAWSFVLSACALAENSIESEIGIGREEIVIDATRTEAEKEFTGILVRWPEHWKLPKVVSGQCKNAGESRLECMALEGKEIALSWGDLWNDVIVEPDESALGEYWVDLNEIQLRWPLQSLDGIYHGSESGLEEIEDVCLRPPSYQLATAKYCIGKEADDRQCEEIEVISSEPPSLAELGWGESKPLPRSLFIQLFSSFANPLYKEEISLELPLGSSNLGEDQLLSSKLYHMDKLELHRFETPELKYDRDAQLIIFRTRQACMHSDISQRLERRPYSYGDLSNVELQACSWGKVVRGGLDISRCVQANVHDDKLEFPLVSNQIDGDRAVIVIARANAFESDGTGAEIQRRLSKRLKELKTEGERVPLNLLTIERDGKVRQILRGEDLEAFELSSNQENAPPNIEGVINENITFYADGLRPLEGLEFVERKLFALNYGQVDKVLYITDGKLPKKIFNAELGTPLGWDGEGVELFVLTKGECQPWIDRAGVSKRHCAMIRTKRDVEKFDEYLKVFTAF